MTIKILGVQFAANPDYKFGDPETEEMWMRTITLLTELRDRKPRVVLKAEPTNPHDEKAVMARAMGQKIGYVNRDQRDEVRRLLRLSKRGMLGAEVDEVVIGNHGYLYKLPYDASKEYHEYGFNWLQDSITWYIDGKPVYKAYDTILPSHKQNLMANVWNCIGFPGWSGEMDDSSLPATASYRYFGYSPAE